MISKTLAFRILSYHGWTPTDLTAFDARTGTPVPYTSFYDQFGEAETYNRRDLMQWLGY